MSALSSPLVPKAVDEYVRQIIEVIIAGDPADAAAIETAVETFDETDAVQQERFRQVMDDVMRVAGKNLDFGQVTGFSIDVAGSGYAVGDQINVTTSTGQGCAAYVKTVDGGGAILTVEQTSPGVDYDVTDTATTITTTGGAGATVSCTVAKNFRKMLEDAKGLLLA